jgi:hypothetical protein
MTLLKWPCLKLRSAGRALVCAKIRSKTTVTFDEVSKSNLIVAQHSHLLEYSLVNCDRG